MGDRVRLAFGILGNAASLMLYAAPMFTFARVIKKRSTEEFSCVPYNVALLNCLMYTWYGLPVVSHLWENFSLVTINGLGIILELIFIIIYFWFATPKGKIRVAAIFVPLVLIFSVTAAVSAFVFHDHHHRKVVVGSVGMVGSVAMYSSPLVAVKKVIETKSVEYMPFSLSFFSFLATTLWAVYGLFSHDLVLASPNLVGCPMALIQLIVYFKYRRASVVSKWDAEKNNIKANDDNKVNAQNFELLVVDVVDANDAASASSASEEDGKEKNLNR